MVTGRARNPHGHDPARVQSTITKVERRLGMLAPATAKVDTDVLVRMRPSRHVVTRALEASINVAACWDHQLIRFVGVPTPLHCRVASCP